MVLTIELGYPLRSERLHMWVIFSALIWCRGFGSSFGYGVAVFSPVWRWHYGPCGHTSSPAETTGWILCSQAIPVCRWVLDACEFDRALCVTSHASGDRETRLVSLAIIFLAAALLVGVNDAYKNLIEALDAWVPLFVAAGHCIKCLLNYVLYILGSLVFQNGVRGAAWPSFLFLVFGVSMFFCLWRFYKPPLFTV